MEERKSILTAHSISVAFNGMPPVLTNVSFEVKDKDMLAVIGPNGAGKSVLLKTLIGIIKPTAGNFSFRSGTTIGYLPQRFHVDYYLPMTIKEFLGLKPHPKYSIDEALGLVNIGNDWKGKKLGLISSGQLQQVLLAWSIMHQPNLLLVDEPTENVDIGGQESIYHLLHHLKEKLGTAVVIVSHDLTAVSHHASNVLCINTHRVCYGPPELTITKETISSLYGEKAFLHYHPHKHEH